MSYKIQSVSNAITYTTHTSNAKKMFSGSLNIITMIVDHVERGFECAKFSGS